MLRASQQRGEGNLETAVEFLPRPRQPGLSRDHFEAGPWLRPQPAIMAPFITGPHIIAGILVARHLKTTEDLFDTRESPRTRSMVAAAVQWAERRT